MARADWTYELPPGAADPVGLENYAVYGSDGQAVGKVFAVLEHGGKLFLGFDRSPVPLKHERRVVSLELVARIDHENLGVELRIPSSEVDRNALELDPDKGIEAGEAGARRVVDLPPDLLPDFVPPAPAVGREQTVRRALAPFLYAIAAVTALGVGAAYEATRRESVVLFALIPVALVAFTVVWSFRARAAPLQRREVA